MTYCYFCSRPLNEVKRLISANNGEGAICDVCIETCHNIVLDDGKEGPTKNEKTNNLLTPQEIYELLEDVIAGQQEAKRTLALIAYLHQIRVNNKNLSKNIKKANVLIIGPSGSGKTMLLETLRDILNVPMSFTDATTLTEVGYVGSDAEECISKLLNKAGFYDGNIDQAFALERAEKGICVIDEFDKKAKRSNDTNSRDISGESVQQMILKLLEGNEVTLSNNNNKKNMHQEVITVDTTNILFILSGAFEGLEKIILKSLGNNIGFDARHVVDKNSNYDEVINHFKKEHLIKYGFIPELIGRLPIIVFTKNLTKENIIEILTKKKKNIIDEYKIILNYHYESELVVKDEFIDIIAEKIYKDKTGARSIRGIFSKIFSNVLFALPSIKKKIQIILDKDTALKEEAVFTYVAAVEKEKPTNTKKSIGKL